MDTRAAKGQATRERIIRIAAKLFAKAGYEAVSIELVLAKSGLSRGALYHHFDGKAALFEAVLEAMESDIAQQIRAASRGVADPVAALRLGCDAWIGLSRRPAIRQIVLIDAPAVLGWEKWREIDARFGFGLLKASLKAAASLGRIERGKVEIAAHVLLAALMEVVLVIARSNDPEREAGLSRSIIGELIDKLVGPIVGDQPLRSPRAFLARRRRRETT
jgi:AcrR family transcriptional regulator